MKKPGIRSVIRNSSFLFSSHLLTTLLRIAYVTILARMMEPETYGLLNYSFSWYLSFIALTTLGLDVLLIREIGLNHNTAPKLAGSTFVLRGGIAIVLTMLSTMIAYVFEPNPVAKVLIIIFSSAIIGRALWLWCCSVFTAFEDTRYIFFLELIFRPLEIIVIIYLFLNTHELVYVGIAHSILWLIQGIVSFIIIKKITPIKLLINWFQAKELIVSGIPGGLYTLALSWFMQAPVILYRQVLGTGEDLGQFGLAMQFIAYLAIIPALIGNAALPVLSRSSARNDGKDKKAALTLLMFIPAIGLIVSLLGMYLAAPLTTFIFGEKYENAGIILSEAIWLLIPFSLAIGLQQFVFSRKSSLLVSFWGILGLITMMTLFSPLTHALLYQGALIAIGLGLTVWACGLILSLRKILNN